MRPSGAGFEKRDQSLRSAHTVLPSGVKSQPQADATVGQPTRAGADLALPSAQTAVDRALDRDPQGHRITRQRHSEGGLSIYERDGGQLRDHDFAVSKEVRSCQSTSVRFAICCATDTAPGTGIRSRWRCDRVAVVAAAK